MQGARLGARACERAWTVCERGRRSAGWMMPRREEPQSCCLRRGEGKAGRGGKRDRLERRVVQTAGDVRQGSGRAGAAGGSCHLKMALCIDPRNQFQPY